MSTTNDFDHKAAHVLIQHLQKMNVLEGRPSITQGASSFANIRKDCAEAEITRILKWYIAHMDHRFTPQAWSARSFYQKFDQIRAAMYRHQGIYQGHGAIEISETAHRIEQELGVQWPSHVNHDELKQEELATIQTSIDNYMEHKRRIVRLYTKVLPGTRSEEIDSDGAVLEVNHQVTIVYTLNVYGWCKMLLGHHDSLWMLWHGSQEHAREIIPHCQDHTFVHQVSYYVREWMFDVHQMIYRWDEKGSWNGAVFPHRWHIQSARYDRAVKELARERGYSLDMWPAVQQLLLSV